MAAPDSPSSQKTEILEDDFAETQRLADNDVVMVDAPKLARKASARGQKRQRSVAEDEIVALDEEPKSKRGRDNDGNAVMRRGESFVASQVEQLRGIFPTTNVSMLSRALDQAIAAGAEDVIVHATHQLLKKEVPNSAPPPPSLAAGASPLKKLPSLTGFGPDFLELVEMFPDTDPNEIFELLEREKTKGTRDPKLVISNRLLGADEPAAAPIDVDDDDVVETGPPTSTADGAIPTGNDPFSRDVALLAATFPDAEMSYIYEQVMEHEDDTQRVMRISNVMLENRYPKKKDKERGPVKKKLTAKDVDLTKAKDYKNKDLVMSDNYKAHATAHLSNRFPVVPLGTLKKVIETYNGHFYLCLRDLELQDSMKPKQRGWYNLKKNRAETKLPDIPCEEIEVEILYCDNEYALEAAEKKKVQDKEARFKAAEQAGQLVECGCCYGQFLMEDMGQCTNAHLFCLECCKRAAGEVIGAGKLEFKCFSMDPCTAFFSQNEWKRFLDKPVFEAHLQRIQQEELRQAGLEGLVSCPFCNFAVIMDDPDNKVLQCGDPKCGKASCRLCKELSHIPLRCNEVEKKDEAAMRKFVEERMTEALLRTCYKCKRKFFKTEGCNHMTCSCGAEMCYVCGEPLVGNWGPHFSAGKCPGSSDNDKLNSKNALDGGKEALAEYKRLHPDVKLKYNPVNPKANKLPALWN